MPRSAVVFGVWQRVRQGAVRHPPLSRRSLPVHGRSRQRVAPLGPCPDEVDEPGRFAPGQVGEVEPQRSGGPGEHGQVVPVAGRQEHEHLAWPGGERLKALGVGVGDARDGREGVGQWRVLTP